MHQHRTSEHRVLRAPGLTALEDSQLLDQFVAIGQHQADDGAGVGLGVVQRVGIADRDEDAGAVGVIIGLVDRHIVAVEGGGGFLVLLVDDGFGGVGLAAVRLAATQQVEQGGGLGDPQALGQEDEQQQSHCRRDGEAAQAQESARASGGEPGDHPRRQDRGQGGNQQLGDVLDHAASGKLGEASLQGAMGQEHAEEVRQRVRQRQPSRDRWRITPRQHQHQRGHHVRTADPDLQQEGRPGVVESVERTQVEVLDRVRHQADPEGGQGPGDEVVVAGAGAVAEDDPCDRIGQSDERSRGRNQEGQCEAQCPPGFDTDAGEVALGGSLRRGRQHRRCQRNREQRMGQDPDQVGVLVGRHSRAGLTGGSTHGRSTSGEAGDHNLGQRRQGDETHHPLRDVEGVAQPGALEIETRPIGDADPPQHREQDHGLRDDAHRRADAEQPHLLVGEGDV